MLTVRPAPGAAPAPSARAMRQCDQRDHRSRERDHSASIVVADVLEDKTHHGADQRSVAKASSFVSLLHPLSTAYAGIATESNREAPLSSLLLGA